MKKKENQFSIVRVISGTVLLGLPSLSCIALGIYKIQDHLVLGKILFFLGITIVWASAIIKAGMTPRKGVEESRKKEFRAIYYSINLIALLALFLLSIKEILTQEIYFWMTLTALIIVQVGLIRRISKIEKSQPVVSRL